MIAAEAYQSSFDFFLSHTDEKPILQKNIVRIAVSRQVKSLLEIGPGNGVMSERIVFYSGIRDYLALEQRLASARLVRQRGLSCLHCEFPPPSPVLVNDTYQMVLSCHSIEHRHSTLTDFIFTAESLLVPGGALLIVTYMDEEDDDWKRLCNSIGLLDEAVANRSFFLSLQELLLQMGKVEDTIVVSRVNTTSLDDMLRALSFVASNGDPSKAKDFLSRRSDLLVVLEQYRTKAGYSFPFRHHFLLAEKPQK